MSEAKIPENKACKDCFHFGRCAGLFNQSPESRECDFIPIRFFEPKEGE